MRDLTNSKLTDFLTQALAAGLVLLCVVFAGYKVMKLQGMDNPPADMGLNFPPPKRKIITDDSILVDPMTTGAVGFQGQDVDGTARVLQPFTNEAPIQDYRLLTVIDGVAFVEVLTLRGKEIMPIVPGARLPGAGRVERIVQVDGRWVLIAGEVRLVAERRQ